MSQSKPVVPAQKEEKQNVLPASHQKSSSPATVSDEFRDYDDEDEDEEEEEEELQPVVPKKVEFPFQKAAPQPTSNLFFGQ